MAASLSLESVLRFIQERGGRASQHDITKHFKKFVKDPDNPDAKEQLKDIVNKLAHIEKIDGVKYLVLRKKYQVLQGIEHQSLPPVRCHSTDALDSASTGTPALEASASQSLSSSLQQLMLENISHSQSIPDLPSHNEHESEVQTNINFSQPTRSTKSSVSSRSDAEEGSVSSTPVAPPRRKSMREVNKTKAPGPPQQSGNSEMPDKDAPRISVKEQAKYLNRMVSQSQLNLQAATASPNKKSDKAKKHDNDEDNGSVSNLDPRAREWMLNSSNNSYHDLVRLLKDDNRLASYKDPLFGYTALHWAAKFGNLDIIKLIAGTHSVNVNLTSNGGYTALHLAAMHDQKNAYDLLVKTYGAKMDLRDYSGKTARQHFSSEKKKVSSSGKNSQPNSKQYPQSSLSVPNSPNPSAQSKLPKTKENKYLSFRSKKTRLRMSARKTRPASVI